MMENILHQYPTINDCYYTKQLARINNLDIIQAKIDEKLDRKSQWQVAVYVKEKIVEAQTTCFGRGSNDLKKIPGNYYWGDVVKFWLYKLLYDEPERKMQEITGISRHTQERIHLFMMHKVSIVWQPWKFRGYPKKKFADLIFF